MNAQPLHEDGHQKDNNVLMDPPASKTFALRATVWFPLVLRQFLFAAVMVAALSPPAEAGIEQPLPPMAVTADTTDQGVQVSWTPPVLSPVEIMSYGVYRVNGTQKELLRSVPADQTTYLDGSADLEYVYTYFVTSQSAHAESPPSNPTFAGYPYCWDVTYDECLFPVPIGSVAETSILNSLPHP